MISIFAAIDRNRGIGKDNKLPWKIRGSDLPRFKAITSGHPIVMGRKTFESIGRPLPYRNNIVVTRNEHYPSVGIDVVHSFSEALELAQKYDPDEVFIIGGAELYKQAMPLADRIYLTLIDHEFDVDTYFPEYEKFFKVSDREDIISSGYSLSYITLDRI